VGDDAEVLPPLTPLTLLTSWTFDPLGAGLALALTGLYILCLVRAHLRWAKWHWARAMMFLILGIGTLVYATCGGLAVYRSTLFWVAAVQAAVLSAVTGMGLALGDPMALAEKALGDKGIRRLRRSLTGPLPRILMFPLVSSLLAVGSLIVVFFTGYLTASVSHLLIREVLYLQLLLTGLFVVLPLLSQDLLPPWCTHPVRALVAFVDGLLDAIPGILVMTAPTLLAPGVTGFTNRTWGPGPALDQKLGGGAMIAVAEIVGLPLLTAVFIAWVRADDADARQTDAFLDARAAEVAESAESVTPVLERPWWENDPRFSNRHP
jgi:putative copper resistance protein D